MGIIEILNEWIKFRKGCLSRELTFDMKETYMVAALTLGGLAYMHIICKPYNTYRGVLMGVLSLGIVLFLTLFMGFFDLPNITYDFKLNWPFMALLVALIQFDVTIGHLLTRLIEFVNLKFVGKK